MTSNRKDVKMTRKKAKEHLDIVQQRILEVNRNPNYCYRVIEAHVFGPYVNAPEKNMLSDLDIAIKLEPKYKINGNEMNRKRKEQEYWRTDLEWYAWPRTEVLRYIRHRCGYVSLDTGLGNPDEDKIIFSGPTMKLEV